MKTAPVALMATGAFLCLQGVDQAVGGTEIGEAPQSFESLRASTYFDVGMPWVVPCRGTPDVKV